MANRPYPFLRFLCHSDFTVLAEVSQMELADKLGEKRHLVKVTVEESESGDNFD